MSTLLLDTANWDLTLDSYNGIAVAQPPYSIAQDVASALKLFSGELWYDTTQGLPYTQDVLGKLPPLGFLKAKLEAAAMTVVGVASATAYITGFVDRNLVGQVQVTMVGGGTAVVGTDGTPWYVQAVSP